MKTLTSSEARRQWRDVLDEVQSGASVVITRHGRAVATIRPADDIRDVAPDDDDGTQRG